MRAKRKWQVDYLIVAQYRHSCLPFRRLSSLLFLGGMTERMAVNAAAGRVGGLMKCTLHAVIARDYSRGET